MKLFFFYNTYSTGFHVLPSSEWLHTGFCHTLLAFPSFLAPGLCLTSSYPRSSTLPGEAFPSTMLSRPIETAKRPSGSLENIILLNYCCSLGYYSKVCVFCFVTMQHWTCGFLFYIDTLIVTDKQHYWCLTLFGWALLGLKQCFPFPKRPDSLKRSPAWTWGGPSAAVPAPTGAPLSN